MARRLTQSSELQPLIKLWILRLLVPIGAHKTFISKHGFHDDVLAESLGMDDWIDADFTDIERRKILAELRQSHIDTERKYRDVTSSTYLVNNIARLSELLDLSQTDGRLLEFAILIRNEYLLDSTADLLGPLSSEKLLHTIAALLDISEQDIRSSMSPQGILTKSGLLTIERDGLSDLSQKLKLLGRNFASTMISFNANPLDMLSDVVVPSAQAELNISDYEHINPSLSILLPYLNNAIADGRKGVNILLYGDPGTGKNQLVKVLAREINCELFEVASEDDDGDPTDGSQRLCAFRAAQYFFAQRRALILFDEIEDVFKDGGNFYGKKSTAQTRKAWMNRMLEQNTVPTMWSALRHRLE